ncbi:uncharacterized protein GLRG_04010 [Colletotrichum graminicola M1.001]|uniref:Uncharacterized protein n=1 Tax=Colletotrichum graminicola (strain M1.001 / M2 / FGSC 10212) TaxID=645133 RepID=E3QD94_COLGM|nr:uncharacterized protein GLRG_04010 [Colletotrichum graminicola M1.001]EFQ28866.1 hypothetical protein GLRG_04010 [Colletotrichum graminicola M1.001]
MTPFKATQPLKVGDLNLAKPFSSNDHRALAQEVGRLIKIRGDMGNKMTESMKHLNQSKDVQLQQELLLQIKVLADRKKLFELDPSDARARDVEILKSLLSKLHDENQTPKRGHKDKSFGCGAGGASSVDWDYKMSGPGRDNDDYRAALEKDLSMGPTFSITASSTKKRKRADETARTFKEAENGVSTVDHGQNSQEDINMNMEKSAKKNKIKQKAISISSFDAESMEDGSNQGADACLTDSKASKAHDGLVNVEINYGYDDEAKKDKAKKNKKLSKPPKSKCSFVVETEHETDDNSKKPTGQVSKAEKHNSGAADDVKEYTKAKKEAKMKKQKKRKKHRVVTTATGSDNVVVIDADQQRGLGELETCSGDHSNLELDALKGVEKENQTTDDTVVNTKQKCSELRKRIQVTDSEQSAANEGNKTWRRNRAMASETNSRVFYAGQEKAEDAGSYGSEAAFSTTKRALKGPTRIRPPVIPVPSFFETAGRTPLNPWSAYRRASIEHIEKAEKPQDDQVWVLGTTGSRKKGGLEDSDTKIFTKTIGKVDAPTKVDQSSPTPLPKKDQKKKTRLSRKVKKPVVPLDSLPEIAQGKTSVPGVRVSEDLVRLITPYAALLGSVERAESLNKLLAKPGVAQRREEDLVQDRWSPA